ncbi:MAG: hypothetical protein FDZ69_04130 [Deltaproteobacteria bacterium]|nr:MAG: hypothetical protein FDZ69_04130 [Deltaproteobacteria bacterium]
MSDASLLLIVRQRPAAHPELERLLEELQAGFGYDPYTTRQRLLGPGLAQLAQGGRVALDGPAALLRRHGYACWIIVPPRPAFAPPRLRNLNIGAEAVEFLCEKEQRVRLERGTPVVGVLADLSGELAGRQVKRLLAQHAYLGRDQATLFTPEEIRQAIYKGQPVFDCYLLDGEGAVAAAFRVLPGRFNPEGLGGRAGLSAAHNLEAVTRLVGEYAGSFRMHTDFGLSQLPGCLPQPASTEPAAILENLDTLTRYGWLVAALAESSANSRAADDPSPGTVLAAVAGGVVAVPGELAAVAGELDAAAKQSPPEGRPVRLPPLPPPPERPDPPSSLRQRLPVIALAAGGLLLGIAGKSDLLAPLLDRALRSGLLPGAAAVGLCWGAFACLRLKRFVENTPTSRIRSLAMGLVEVRGRAIRRYALVAPMTQSACVWYRLRRYRRDQRNNWTLTSQSDSGHVPFVLDDGSGRVVIDPAGATVRAKTEQTGFPGESTLLGAATDGGPDEKWVEELIYEGTTLYVLGQARPAREVGAGLRGRTAELLRRLKLDPHALRRYDTNGDGRLDADEWQAARDDAEQLAAAEQLGEPREPAVDPVLLGKPSHGMPFLIAEGETGGDLAKRYGWFAAVLLMFGAAAFILAVKLALDHFQSW